MKRKGQLTLSDAPGVIVMVGLLFLTMATIALIADRYNDAFPSDTLATRGNEAVTNASIRAGYTVAGASDENAERFTLIAVRNSTGNVNNANFSLNTNTGLLTNTSTITIFGATFQVNYTFYHSGVASNVTTALNTEISNNTSIAGIVLTISLVGIVLSILTGVFLSLRTRRI